MVSDQQAMDCLPNDIILPILSCLEVEDICRCGCIARAWAASVHFDPIASRVCTVCMVVYLCYSHRTFPALKRCELQCVVKADQNLTYFCVHFAPYYRYFMNGIWIVVVRLPQKAQ